MLTRRLSYDELQALPSMELSEETIHSQPKCLLPADSILQKIQAIDSKLMPPIAKHLVMSALQPCIICTAAVVA